MADSVSADAFHRLRLILDTPLMTGLGVAEQRYTPCIGWSARRTAPACTSRSGTKLPLRA